MYTKRLQVQTTEFNLPPILDRDKNIRKSKLFLNIFRDFIYKDVNNIPRTRFPGDKEMVPLKEAFPDLIEKAKTKLNKILDQNKKYISDIEKLLLEQEKNNGDKNFISILNDEIQKLKIEIQDTEKYINQLD